MWNDVLRKLGTLVAPPLSAAVRAAGRIWHFSPEGEALLGPAGPAFDQWLADGSAEVVKSGPHRTVYRVTLEGGTVYAKHCRINGPRAWAREVLRPPKARLEFENAARLHALGIGAAVPLAWGTADSVWPGESFLITRDLAPAIPFTDFMETRFPALAPRDQCRVRRQLARGLGRFLAHLHNSGVTHPDPHPGNVLIEWEGPTPPAPLPKGKGEEEPTPNPSSPSPALSAELLAGRGKGGEPDLRNPNTSAVPEEALRAFTPSLQGGGWGVGSSGVGVGPFVFSLLDVHAVRCGPPLSWAASRANLILYNRWFQLRASAADRLRFWREYARARKALPFAEGGRAEATELERATLASNRRFWLARTARYAGTHRTVRKLRGGGVRGLAVRDLPPEFLNALIADPDAAFARPGTKLLKQCVSSTVAELPMPTPDGPRAVILKRVNLRSALDPAKNLFRSSAVRRSWLLGHGLCERWLPTPRPLAMFHRTRAGILPAEGYLLTEKVPDAVGLPEAVQACTHTRTLRTWAERVARVIRTMHDRGVSHRDLKAPNVMLRGAAVDPASATPALIDLVGVRASADAVPFARRAKELARLNASFLEMHHVTRSERLRFLRAYLATGAREPDWKRWWKAVSKATAAKVAKNRRAGRPIG